MNEKLSEIFMKEPLDHEGSARCVVAMYPNVYKFTPSHGWLVYNGRYWEADMGASAGRAVVKVLRARDELITAKVEDPKIAAAMKKNTAANNWAVNGIRARLQEQNEIFSDISVFDDYPEHLNCANGLVNLRTGEIEPHGPNQLVTYCIPINYDPDAYSEDWQVFLDEVVNEELQIFLQIMTGYLLTGYTSEECLFYIYGPTRSGKGTFSEVITTVMGTLAVGLNFKTFTADRVGDTQNFDLAPLKNKRLVVASESRKNERLNEAVLKQATGGDEIYCAHKGKQHFSYRPQFKIVLSSNHPANTDPTDAAAWGRLRVIHFANSFLGREDMGLKQRLKTKENLEGVFNWMVQGAIAWFSSGLPVPKEVSDLTAKQQIMANSVAMFIDQCCSIDPDGFEPGTPLFRAYSDWCKEEGYQPLGRKNFTMALGELGIESDRQTHAGKVSRGFVGIDYSGYGLGDEAITKGHKYGMQLSLNGQSVN